MERLWEQTRRMREIGLDHGIVAANLVDRPYPEGSYEAAEHVPPKDLSSCHVAGYRTVSPSGCADINPGVDQLCGSG